MKLALVVPLMLGCSAQSKPPPHNMGASPPPVADLAGMAIDAYRCSGGCPAPRSSDARVAHRLLRRCVPG